MYKVLSFTQFTYSMDCVYYCMFVYIDVIINESCVLC